MSTPPYHLRPNKAVDRLAFIEAIRRLQIFADSDDYQYYTLGGPYLEDMRLMYESFPDMQMVSIEHDAQIYKRQKFHLPCGNIELRETDLYSFVDTYESGDEQAIFWLDYTGLEFKHFEGLMTLLPKVTENSMVKVTLEADPKKFMDAKETDRTNRDEFKKKFGALIPESAPDPPIEQRLFAALVQSMVRVSAERSFPAGSPIGFEPISSFFYADTTPMFTLTGIVCSRNRTADLKKAYKGWQLVNFDWKEPRRIDLPALSTRERLHLQHLLPVSDKAGKVLCEALGYLIEGNDRRTTEKLLKQYADFHRYSPYFIRGIP
jgi:hypothetical protein